jgi:hypothetical protein
MFGTQKKSRLRQAAIFSLETLRVFPPHRAF